MKSFKRFNEDMGGGAIASGPTNTAGGGAVAGIGVGKSGEPGVDLKKKKKVVIQPMATRKSLQ